MQHPIPTVEPVTIARPRASLAARLLLLAVRLGLVLAGAWAAQRVPLPLLEDGISFKAPLIAIATVILGGKVAYDTLFYDRFRP
jgi:hypothetical protein